MYVEEEEEEEEEDSKGDRDEAEAEKFHSQDKSEISLPPRDANRGRFSVNFRTLGR